MMYLAPQIWRRRCAQVQLLRADARARGQIGIRWIAAAMRLVLGTAAESMAYYLGVLTVAFTGFQAALAPRSAFDQWVREAVSYAAPAALWFGLASAALAAGLVLWKTAHRRS